MSDFNEQFNKFTDTRDHTSECDPGDVERNKVMGVLAYLSWLVIIPLVAAKDSRFARFHCGQGIILAIAELICWVAFGILGRLPLIGWIFSVLNGLVSLAALILAIIGIVNAVNGRAKELPVVGGFSFIG